MKGKYYVNKDRIKNIAGVIKKNNPKNTKNVQNLLFKIN